MSEQNLSLTFGEQDGQRFVQVGGVMASTATALVAAAPALSTSMHLGQWADAVNHLARGEQYRVIHDVAAFRAAYEARFQAQAPGTPFRDGVPQPRLFGHADLGEVQPPRVEGSTLLFYAEHDYLGIPYRVTGPAPGAPGGEIEYIPVAMAPITSAAI